MPYINMDLEVDDDYVSVCENSGRSLLPKKLFANEWQQKPELGFYKHIIVSSPENDNETGDGSVQLKQFACEHIEEDVIL